ncbi:hypothetical protein RSJ42_07110 [Methanosarcina hadiensis]|uniref:COG1470 family protein n=1 Tax=Methanosarcina hadiensis TaxID=3078083 RepID=UPI0039779E74
MSKSAFMKAMSLSIGILLCLASVPFAFAQEYSEKNNVAFNESIRHEIYPSENYLYLGQGESSSFSIMFTNNDDKALEIEPRIVPVSGSSDFDESWITISPAKVTVDSGEIQEFDVKVSIPEDASGGENAVYITFTDDIDIYSQLINKMYLSIMVPVEQKLELQTTYISDYVAAGQEYTYTVKMKNVASKTITIDPKITSYDYSFGDFGLDDADIEITAPSTLEPGEVADMVIRVPVPEDATGTYNGYIGMNVEGDDYWYEPQLDLQLTVLQDPSVSYVKTFSTSTKEPITIEVSAYTYSSGSWLRIPPQNEAPSFELSLKYNSSPVKMNLIKTTQTGNIGIGWNYFPTWSNEDGLIYENYGSYYTETYTVPGQIGDWSLEILPKNVQSFEYSISIGDSDKK